MSQTDEVQPQADPVVEKKPEEEKADNPLSVCAIII